MEKKNSSFVSKLNILLLSAIFMLSWSCSNPGDTGKNYANQPPRTRLSNVPPTDRVTLQKSPIVTLSWIGDDADGFITGFMYRWNYTLDNQQLYRKYSIVLNIEVQEFTLMLETEDPAKVPAIYKYFANLVSNDGLSDDDENALIRGDTIVALGTRVYASNPDSILLQTGSRVRYSEELWVHKNPRTGKFIFESPDEENFHTFEIMAIDNNGARSPAPATVSFITPQVQAPRARITGGPERNKWVLVRKGKTPTFPGLRFDYKGVDPNTRTMDYRWVVDKDKWMDSLGSVPWSEFTTNEFVYVTADDFPDPYDSLHTFLVQARNEFGVIDTVGLILDDFGNVIDSSYRTFKTIYPDFLRYGTERILLINDSFDPLIGTPTYPYYWDVDSFYHSILHGLGQSDDIIDNFRMGRDIFPTLGEIGKYSLVIFFADATGPTNFSRAPNVTVDTKYEQILKDYCYMGGDLIMSSWNLSGGFYMVKDGEFFDRVIHVASNSPGRADDLYIGARGQLGYPDLKIDTLKADSSWRYGMDFVPVNIPEGFGEIIHKYDAKYDFPTMENASLSVRYRGITFNSAYFGMPLYYMERPAVDSTIAHVLYDFKTSKEERPK